VIVPLSDVSEAFLLTIVESVDIASDEMKKDYQKCCEE
jgi:hypothetical protein